MDKFIQELEELFEMDENSINPEDEFRDYEEWDSLAMLGLGAMINEEYNITISRTEFEKIITIKELFNYIQNHL